MELVTLDTNIRAIVTECIRVITPYDTAWSKRPDHRTAQSIRAVLTAFQTLDANTSDYAKQVYIYFNETSPGLLQGWPAVLRIPTYATADCPSTLSGRSALQAPLAALQRFIGSGIFVKA